MQKKLIALAVAAAVAAPMAAQAEVKIYGKMHASWDWIDTDDGAGDDNDDQTGVFRASRLGFKGSEDLGNGLKAIWQVETQINTADGDGGGDIDLRNTFVGLNGNWGTVLLGRHDTPYKIATSKLDIFADTLADYNAVIGTVSNTSISSTTGATIFDERVPQTVAYITPSFNGFTAAIARASHKINEGTGTGTDDNDAWSVMGMYDNGPFFASLAYETHSGGALGAVVGGSSSAGDDADAWKLGLGYSFGNSKVGLVYEDISWSADANLAATVVSAVPGPGGTVTGLTPVGDSATDYDRQAYYVNFSHKFSNNVLKVAYGHADDSDSVVSDGTIGARSTDGLNDSADFWAIGIDHNFSPRTTVYALYATMDNDDAANYGLNSGQQVGTGAANSGAGNDVSGVSVGLIHKF